METQIQYIFSQDQLESALINVLSKFNLIKQSESQVRPPATTEQACDFLNISRPTLRRLINSDQIKTFNIGSHTRINWSELEAYINIHDTTTQIKLKTAERQTIKQFLSNNSMSSRLRNALLQMNYCPNLRFDKEEFKTPMYVDELTDYTLSRLRNLGKKSRE